MEEKVIINLLLEGKNTNEIATALNVSRNIVDVEVQKIYKKYSVNNRIQLAITCKLNSNID